MTLKSQMLDAERKVRASAGYLLKGAANATLGRTPKTDGSAIGRCEQVCSCPHQMPTPDLQAERLPAGQTAVQPTRVQKVSAEGGRAQCLHAVACDRPRGAREHARASFRVPAMLCPTGRAEGRARTAPSTHRRVRARARGARARSARARSARARSARARARSARAAPASRLGSGLFVLVLGVSRRVAARTR